MFVVVVPSETYEKNSLAVIEAFTLGKPMIGSNIGSIPELVSDNKTGSPFKASSAEDLRHKIHTLKNNPCLIIKMSIITRKFVKNHLNAEAYYNKLNSIYHRFLDSHS